MAAVSKIFHANVYTSGTVNHLGRISEAKLPAIEPVMSEHKALGMFGTLELPSGLGALSMSVKWNGFYADVIKLGANPFKTERIQLRGNHETYDASGRIAEVPYVVTVGGKWKKAGAPTFKAQESGEFDDEVSVHYIKCELAGVTLYEIDVINNIWIVDGVDLMETLRKNIQA